MLASQDQPSFQEVKTGSIDTLDMILDRLMDIELIVLDSFLCLGILEHPKQRLLWNKLPEISAKETYNQEMLLFVKELMLFSLVDGIIVLILFVWNKLIILQELSRVQFHIHIGIIKIVSILFATTKFVDHSIIQNKI